MRILIASLLSLFIAISFAGAAGPVGLSVDRLADDSNLNECPICHRTIIPGHTRDNAVSIVTTELGGYLADKGFTAVPGTTTAPRSLNVLVYRFQERQGGNFAVEKPASAAFHVHLMNGSEVTGVFVFDETQQPLSSNVLSLPTFVKRGAKWITVAELAREGVHAAVDSFADDLIQTKTK